MYRSTHQNHDFINRVANHSTKGSRRGFATIGLLIDESDLKEHPDVVRKQLSKMKIRLITQRSELEKSLKPRDTDIKTWRVNLVKRYKGREHVFGDSRKANELREYFRIGDLLKDIDDKFRILPKKTPIRFETILIGELKKEMSSEIFQNVKDRAHKIYDRNSP